jgi:hypothetical protein
MYGDAWWMMCDADDGGLIYFRCFNVGEEKKKDGEHNGGDG